MAKTKNKVTTVILPEALEKDLLTYAQSQGGLSKSATVRQILTFFFASQDRKSIHKRAQS